MNLTFTLHGLLRRAALCAAMASVLLTGCATTQQPDPLEKLNRATFAFNETVDEYVIAPPARVYRDAVPAPVRQSVTNFFNNLRDVWSAVNHVLQGRPTDGIQDVMRFSVNTVFGIGGLFDVASEMRLDARYTDFGQTLGRWGFGPGAYIVLPILGPSSVRDTAALPLDLRSEIEFHVDDVAARNSLTALRVLSVRSNLLDGTRLLEGIALDKYLFVRDAYLQRRRNQIYDGNPPPEPDDEPAPAKAP